MIARGMQAGCYPSWCFKKFHQPWTGAYKKLMQKQVTSSTLHEAQAVTDHFLCSNDYDGEEDSTDSQPVNRTDNAMDVPVAGNDQDFSIADNDHHNIAPSEAGQLINLLM